MNSECEHQGCRTIADVCFGPNEEQHYFCPWHRVEHGYCYQCRVMSPLSDSNGICILCETRNRQMEGDYDQAAISDHLRQLVGAEVAVNGVVYDMPIVAAISVLRKVGNSFEVDFDYGSKHVSLMFVADDVERVTDNQIYLKHVMWRKG